MFTKSQLATATVLIASASSVVAAPLYNDASEIEARMDQPPYGANNGWINPTPGDKRASKVKQTAQVLAIDKHKENEPGHHAVAPGNTAHVQSGFHVNGGPNHATVHYQNPQGGHVSTLHIGKDGERQVGNNAATHRGGTSPPHNSPASSHHGSPSPKSSSSNLKGRAFTEFLEELEARMDQPPYGANNGWINPTPGDKRASKVKQTAQVLAIDKHKENEPGHHAVAPGNTAHVQSGFHVNGGPNHATVHYQNPQGGHVSTLHIGKDGERQVGNNAATHRGGTSPPHNSPASSHHGSPSPKSSSSNLKGRAFMEYLADLEARQPEHHHATEGTKHHHAHGAKPHGHGHAQGEKHHAESTVADPNSTPVLSSGGSSNLSTRGLMEFIRRELGFYDDLD